ncbi:hypothetical protein PILCRDRAFT_384268 [Piloderma croceum F 1598]|uniref:Uncharacterized protein n=1 Tax=Piloderma croceum (strain F 1598) TaxID=765440 RepID=A0A0C3FXY1_PILCF|nr:hypothetical protein PILCRDRAFT_384268 [Piloderma croceum F 1598]
MRAFEVDGKQAADPPGTMAALLSGGNLLADGFFLLETGSFCLLSVKKTTTLKSPRPRHAHILFKIWGKGLHVVPSTDRDIDRLDIHTQLFVCVSSPCILVDLEPIF